MCGSKRVVHNAVRALQAGIILILYWGMVVNPQPAAAQVGLCARQLSGTFPINGVVGRGPSTASCVLDPIWATVAPAQFSGGDAYLYVAHNTTNDHLYFGIDLKGDQKLSGRDVVMLYFDANNNNSWDNGDFAIRVVVSNADPALESGETCNQATASVQFFPHDVTRWQENDTAKAGQIATKVAYDLSTLAEGGVDAEEDIWNLEIEMPVFNLNVATGFGLGAYAFVDDGSGGLTPVGPVLQYPAGINPAIGISDEDDVAFAEPTALTNLSKITANNVCFDVTFSVNMWEINGSLAEPYDYKIYRNGRRTEPDKGFNTFRVKFRYSSTSGGSGNLPDTGSVKLDLIPYTGGAPGQMWTMQQPVNISAYPQEYVATFKYKFDPLDPGAPPIWGTIVNSNNPNDFVCSDTTLLGFAHNDDPSNDTVHLNHNFFTTSEYTQDIYFFGDSVPRSAFDQDGVAKILIEMRTFNEPKEKAQAPPSVVAASRAPTESSGPASFAAGELALFALLISPIIGLVALTQQGGRGRMGLMRARSRVVRLTIYIVLLAGCIPAPVPQPPTATPGPTRPPLPTQVPPTAARWEFENARELGIKPMEGKPGWYEMPIKAEETKVPRIKFVGRPLPYQTEELKLKPAEGEEPNILAIPVRGDSVVTVVAFGEVDPDGEQGELGPTSPTGFVQEGRDGFLLQQGYYEPYQYAGALIGSFDDFETSFVVGRNISAIVPPEANELKLAVNAPMGEYQLYTGEFDLYVIVAEAPSVPTHTRDLGDATYNIPPQLPIWEVLTSVNMYTYYSTPDIREDKVVGETLHQWGDAHFSIYDTHVDQ